MTVGIAMGTNRTRQPRRTGAFRPRATHGVVPAFGGRASAGQRRRRKRHPSRHQSPHQARSGLRNPWPARLRATPRHPFARGRTSADRAALRPSGAQQRTLRTTNIIENLNGSVERAT